MQPLHYTGTMPTLARLSTCSITLYAADHLPPHFHIRMRDGSEALVELATLAVLAGSLSRRELAEALNWASANQTLLQTKWKELNP